MLGLDDGEMTVVESGDALHAEAFGEGDYRGVNCAEGKVRVLQHQFTHAAEVVLGQLDEFEGAQDDPR